METLINDSPKILIIQTAFPGDAILTLPMIQQLKKRHPGFLIDVLCIPSTSEIFKSSPFVNSVWEFDKREKHKSVFAMLKFVKEIKKNNYLNIYCPHRSLRSAFITLQLGVKETYGFDNSSLKFAFRNVIPYNYAAHEVQRNLELIGEEIGNDDWKVLPEIKISNKIQKKISEFVSKNNLEEKLIAMAPGSVWQTKRYPVEHFIGIVKFLLEKKYKVVIIGGTYDKQISSQIVSEFHEQVIDECGEFSFIENIELLKHAKLLICNDSAPTHLGMCADIPVLTIYCSTVPEFGFYPYNGKSKSISYNELSCKPCGIHGYNSCPISTFECGNLLKPDIVIKTIEEMIR